MTPERWQQVKDLCQRVLDHEPQARSEFLARACADDLDLKREVDTLLQHAASSEAIDGPILKRFGVSVTDTRAVGDAVPAHTMPAEVGRYRVLRVIGEGGMGT